MYKCRLCVSKFEAKGELKEQWNMGEIFCKTFHECCNRKVRRKGTEHVYPDDPECESHEW